MNRKKVKGRKQSIKSFKKQRKTIKIEKIKMEY